MSPLPFLLDAAKSAVILGLALAAMPLLRSSPASTRRLVLALALAASALVPLASRAAPGLGVLPPAELAAAGTPFAEPVGEEIAAPSAPPRSAAVKAPEAAPAAAPAAARPLAWGPVMLAAWALGALAVLGRLAFGLAQARAIARRARPISSDVIDAAARAAGERVEVRVSDEVSAPAVTGVLRPVVLVPPSALEWAAPRWRAVLLHELSHVSRRDTLAQIAAQIACALSWFDPLAWLAAQRLRFEQELAADERALSAGERPTDYAEHLLAVAAAASRSRGAPAGALGMAGRSQLLARVEAIVRPGAGSARPSRAGAAVIAAAFAALLFGAACVTPSSREEAAAPPEPSQGAPVTTEKAAPASPLAAQVAAVVGAPADRVVLTIRPEIQAIVDEEMKRLAEERRPSAATAIVLEPSTGDVIAISDPVMAVRPRPTGSTMKALTIAAALEEKAIAPGDRFSCAERPYGEEVLHDASANGELSVVEILTVSSNVGASRIFDRLGGAKLGAWMSRFHLGQPTSVELSGGQIDAIPASIEDGSLPGALLSMGVRGAVASPMHVAAAYAAIANGGVYSAPGLVRRVIGADGGPVRERAPSKERLLRAETASAVMDMLERAVNDERATGKAARVEGVKIAGKTGTADERSEGGAESYYASFVGVAPADAPRFVILVGAQVSGEGATGGRAAAPVFARIAARALGR